MAGKWHYTIDGREEGPADAETVKQLIRDGKVTADSEVWTEGWPNWKRVSETELASELPTPGLERTQMAGPTPVIDTGGGSQPSASASPKRKSGGSKLPSIPVDSGLFAKLGMPLLVSGLILVLLVRGCDTIGQRWADSYSTAAAESKAAFAYRHGSKIGAIQAKIDALKKDKADAEKASEKTDIQKEIDDLEDEDLKDAKEARDDELKDLQYTTWLRADYNSAMAQSSFSGMAYWRSWLFMLGAMVLSIGLLAVAFTSTGADRWIAMGIIAIVTFSIFVGGQAWETPDKPSPRELEQFYRDYSRIGGN